MRWILYGIVFLSLVLAGCKQSYNAPVKSSGTGYLVVEGFISSGTTNIQLSRTVKLSDTASIIYEHNAQMTIEGSSNDNFILTETGNGVYTNNQVMLNNAGQYRLHIHTAEGKEYISDFESVKDTPPIDSISWKEENDGVQIYANTHDPKNNIQYYLWNYDETWEIHSAYQSTIKYVRDTTTGLITGIAFRLPNYAYDTSIYQCWVSKSSTDVIDGTTEKLSSNVIYLQPLLFIPKSARELSVLFSIHVRQFGMSQAAYQFYEILKKNTEQLGTIFDAQPSLLKGNIHSVSDPSEIVVGYVDVSNERDQRIFISTEQVPDWNYQTDCMLTLLVNVEGELNKYGFLVPVIPYKIDNATHIENFFASTKECVDCTTSGTNIRPSFWPN
jgi:hypothetical protein